MNIETIVKLLKSDNEADYRIGYQLAIKKWCTHLYINRYLRRHYICIYYMWNHRKIIKIYTNWGKDNKYVLIDNRNLKRKS